MKWSLLIVAFFLGSSLQAQSLKDLLYQGKLKKDSTGVIRKNDDLAAKIDSGDKKPARPDTLVAVKSSPADKVVEVTAADSAVVVVVDTVAAVSAEVTAVVESPAPAVPARSNNRIWKDYTDSLNQAIRTEVLANKKIKKETYYVSVDYELETDGSVSILNVTVSPENSLLAGQLKERMIQSAPMLAPYQDSTGNARKVKRKYNFTVTKD